MDDLGDSPVVPWRPDRANPQAQNLQAVLETVQTTTKRVADAWLSGALDWMALGHMLAVEGAEPTLTAAAGNAPSSTPAKSCSSPMHCRSPPGSNAGRSSG